MATALFAAGLNAWRQLEFVRPGRQQGDDTEPDDLWLFSRVLEDESLQRPRAELSSTVVRGSSGLHIAGTGGDTDTRHDQQGQATARAGNGAVLVAVAASENATSTETQLEGTRAASSTPAVLERYATRADYISKRDPSTRWPREQPVRQIAAYDAGFVVLYEDGTVATLGDARYVECLGRDMTTESPAEEPGLVHDLMDIGDPVKVVAAGGLTVAALTESGSIYVWGRASGSGKQNGGGPAFTDLEAIPNYCEVDGGKDVEDLALGESHAIALTTDGDVYVVGSNRNGRIGLGRGHGDVSTWTKVSVHVPTDHRAVAVAAGPRCSFILTAQKP